MMRGDMISRETTTRRQRYTALLCGMLLPSFALYGFIGLDGNAMARDGCWLIITEVLLVSVSHMAWLRIILNGRAWLY